MAPRPRTGWKPDALPKDCRNAAALLLLYPKYDEPYILLTLRTQQLPTHQGQVSLPGGGVHSDETLIEAALRETREEVGIDSEGIHILGLLSPLHIPVSGFILHPVVAVSTERPELHPHDGEVERVLEVSLSTLTDAKHVQVETWIQEGVSYRIPYFLVDDSKVWGATAMVLSEFLCLIGLPPSPWLDP
jgi:8-oxo-dGTP pyrophosphatase MutT (NUDIX family)